MKRQNVCILLLAVLNFCGTDVSSDINKVQIEKVDFELTSVFSVDCGTFEKTFKKDIKKVELTDHKTIEEFSKALATLQADPENYLPDVRCKIIVYHKDGIADTICLSDLGIVIKGKSFLKNQKLVDFVTMAN